MGQQKRTTTAGGEDRPGTVSATEAQNNFGLILDRVNREGAVVIERYGRPAAAVVPISEYRAHSKPTTGSLAALAAEYDARMASMQEPLAAGTVERLFDMTSEELGRAAVKGAGGASRPKRTRTRKSA